jgi:hypothetical protein
MILPLHFQPIYINNQAFRGFKVLMQNVAPFCYDSSKMAAQISEKGRLKLPPSIFVKYHLSGVINEL